MSSFFPPMMLPPPRTLPMDASKVIDAMLPEMRMMPAAAMPTTTTAATASSFPPSLPPTMDPRRA